MKYVGSGVSRTWVLAVACAVAISATARPQAQAPGVVSQPQAPPAARAAAPVDLTGTWVAVVTEDWQWRMVTPRVGDTTSVPLNADGLKVAKSWDPATEGQCEAYGVGGIMRMPGRLRISWQDDLTLKIETDAGQQTRLLRFAGPGGPSSGAAAAGSARTRQGVSIAEWLRAGGAQDAFLERSAPAGGGAGRWGSLKVITTGMLPGWLRRNGVPYSGNAVVTEYFTRFSHPDAGDWFVVTTIVDDPAYLTQPFTTSSNFRKEPNDSKWSPVPCRS